MRGDILKSVELTHIVQPKNGEVRLSFYFDFDEDNHHIQFSECANRREVAIRLRQLADRIRRCGLGLKHPPLTLEGENNGKV